MTLKSEIAEMQVHSRCMIAQLQHFCTGEFNDNKVYHIELTKKIVKKGEEYISVHINELEGIT